MALPSNTSKPIVVANNDGSATSSFTINSLLNEPTAEEPKLSTPNRSSSSFRSLLPNAISHRGTASNSSHNKATTHGTSTQPVQLISLSSLSSSFDRNHQQQQQQQQLHQRSQPQQQTSGQKINRPSPKRSVSTVVPLTQKVQSIRPKPDQQSQAEVTNRLPKSPPPLPSINLVQTSSHPPHEEYIRPPVSRSVPSQDRQLNTTSSLQALLHSNAIRESDIQQPRFIESQPPAQFSLQNVNQRIIAQIPTIESPIEADSNPQLLVNQLSPQQIYQIIHILHQQLDLQQHIHPQEQQRQQYNQQQQHQQHQLIQLEEQQHHQQQQQQQQQPKSKPKSKPKPKPKLKPKPKPKPKQQQQQQQQQPQPQQPQQPQQEAVPLELGQHHQPQQTEAPKLLLPEIQTSLPTLDLPQRDDPQPLQQEQAHQEQLVVEQSQQQSENTQNQISENQQIPQQQERQRKEKGHRKREKQKEHDSSSTTNVPYQNVEKGMLDFLLRRIPAELLHVILGDSSSLSDRDQQYLTQIRQMHSTHQFNVQPSVIELSLQFQQFLQKQQTEAPKKSRRKKQSQEKELQGRKKQKKNKPEETQSQQSGVVATGSSIGISEDDSADPFAASEMTTEFADVDIIPTPIIDRKLTPLEEMERLLIDRQVMTDTLSDMGIDFSKISLGLYSWCEVFLAFNDSTFIGSRFYQKRSVDKGEAGTQGVELHLLPSYETSDKSFFILLSIVIGNKKDLTHLRSQQKRKKSTAKRKTR